ncbi:MAG: PucR family transcriptional regulator ligand-binding domain-containing protein [Anaerolineae bacterium]
MLTIAEALQMEALSTATVVAGQGGLHKTIQWVHMVDIPEMAEWARRGELLFTTAFGLKDNPDLQHTLIPQLVEVGVVGMVIAVGRYFYDIPEVMIRQADELDFPLLTLPWEVPFIEVTRAISEKILQERYNLLQESLRIHNTLTRVVLEGADLNELARALAGLVNCAVTIEDPAFHLLAHAPYGQVDRAREESIVRQQTPPALLSELDRRGVLSQIQQSLHPIRLPPLPEYGLTFERVVAPIIASGEQLGYVWLIVRDRPPGELDLIAIEHAATVAALILLRERAVYEAEQRVRSSFLDELLHGQSHLQVDLMKRATALGLGNKVQVLLLHPMNASQSGTLSSLSRTVTEQLHRQGQRGLVIERSENLVVLLQSDRVEQGLDLARSLWTMAKGKGYKLHIGVGRVAEALVHLPESYEEAREALEVSLTCQSQDGGVVSFEALGMLYWLRHLPAEVQQKNWFYGAVGRLAEYDHRRHAELLSTLETYLDEGCNTQQAADRLHVHRNTLRQRLRKIESLLTLDLKDPQVALNLQVAIKGWRLRDTHP